MITGTSQADAAIITCSAIEGPQAQTKEHVFLATTLGVKQIIVAINKMDAVKYDQAKYDEAVAGMKKLFAMIGNKAENIPFIPVSAYEGDNIKVASPNTPWYKGPTLIQALDALTVPAKETDKALRLPIQDVYTITGIGTVPVGRVETGVLKPKTKVIFMPSNVTGEVKSRHFPETTSDSTSAELQRTRSREEMSQDLSTTRRQSQRTSPLRSSS